MSLVARPARIALAGLVVVAGALAAGASPALAVGAPAPTPGSIPAPALNPATAPCGVAGASRGQTAGECIWGISPGSLLDAGKQVATGNVGGAVRTVAGGAVKTVVSGAAGTIASTATTAIGLAAIGVWVVGGAQGVLHDTAAALGATTSPQLRSTWFSSTYWRMAAIAAVLTLPFLFAAAVQALIRSDLGLLVRAAFGYLPLAMLAIAIVAPVTMLLLAASDQMCTWISSAAGNASADFLKRAGVVVVGLSTIAGSPFLAFLIGLFMIGAAFALWVELLLREAAVYVIVLMLPLAFAALVWPTRRIWAVRAVEVLIALILSKFAIVAVLSLGGAALGAGAGHGGVAELMAGAVLILLAAFSPWALLRLVPLAEVAAGAAGPLRSELRPAGAAADEAIGLAMKGDDALARLAARMGGDDDPVPTDMPDPPRPAGGGSARATTDDEAPTEGGAVDTVATQEDAPDDADEPEAADEPPFSQQRALDLGGPNFGTTPVHPHPEAE
jgi:hypothetical protein